MNLISGSDPINRARAKTSHEYIFHDITFCLPCLKKGWRAISGRAKCKRWTHPNESPVKVKPSPTIVHTTMQLFITAVSASNKLSQCVAQLSFRGLNEAWGRTDKAGGHSPSLPRARAVAVASVCHPTLSLKARAPS